jgi:hypothetical protein
MVRKAIPQNLARSPVRELFNRVGRLASFVSTPTEPRRATGLNPVPYLRILSPICQRPS